MVEASTALDWQEVYARLEQTRQRLEASSALPPAEVRRLLRERAQALARPLVEPPTVIDVLDLAVFVLAEVRYGIEAAYVLEVTPLRELTPVPCTPPHILGVVNHRGRLLPILDLRKLFALGRVDELFDDNPCGHKMNECEKGLAQFLIPRGNASKLFEFVKEPFHLLP
jgi:purine-binding chemotaxis protein CheW